MGRASEAESDFAESLRTAGARRPMIQQLIQEYKKPATQKR